MCYIFFPFPGLFFIIFLILAGLGLRLGFGVGVFSWWGLGPVVWGLLGLLGWGSLYKHKRITLGKKLCEVCWLLYWFGESLLSLFSAEIFHWWDWRLKGQLVLPDKSWCNQGVRQQLLTPWCKTSFCTSKLESIHNICNTDLSSKIN